MRGQQERDHHSDGVYNLFDLLVVEIVDERVVDHFVQVALVLTQSVNFKKPEKNPLLVDYRPWQRGHYVDYEFAPYISDCQFHRVSHEIDINNLNLQEI